MAGHGGRERTAEEVDAEGDHEQVSASPLVGHAAEEESTGYLSEQVDGADGEGDSRVERWRAGLIFVVTLLAMVISRPSTTQATPRAMTNRV